MDIQTGVLVAAVAMLITRIVPAKKQKEDQPAGTSQKKLKSGVRGTIKNHDSMRYNG